MSSTDYPPKNRRPTELPVTRIEIEHAGGVDVFDPNQLIYTVLAKPDEIASLQPLTGRVSDISGEPAVVYRSLDMEIALRPEELLRLLCNDLRRSEFFSLRGSYGDAYEWHDDFYDARTGEALQPRKIDQVRLAAVLAGLKPIKGAAGTFLVPPGPKH